VNHTLVAIAFWVAAGVIAYVYLGYPLLLAAWAHIGRLGGVTPAPNALPRVSIVLAARNEADRLEARLDNLLSLDYPPGLREVIVVSDGSTDGTADIIDRYGAAIRSVFLPAAGKASALNSGVAAARHEVLVFADARQAFASDALRRLVEPLADPRVAGVSGELVIVDAEAPRDRADKAESAVAEGVGLYWRYEKWLRQRESEVGSTLGATGAIWALRRSAWRPLPPETLLDDVLAPMRAVLAGSRVVFAPGAKAYDRGSPDALTEHRRKVRTLAGNYQLLRLEPRLLLPFANPVWLQFVSHKLGRLVVPYALAVLAWASAVLARDGLVYASALVGQVAFYILAAHGAIAELGDPADRPRRRRSAPAGRKELVNAQGD
jgi:poly-beta-1,6-N-acetyl-D-glucosamine synthase